MQKSEGFFKIYANLPLSVRDEVILVLKDKGPITWNIAYLEISQNTSVGQQILDKLEALHII